MDGAEEQHVPVLAEETVAWLAPQPGGCYVDCTVGNAGHSLRLAAALGRGRLIGFDKDPVALGLAEQRWREHAEQWPNVSFELVHADFAEMKEALQTRGVTEVNGVVADFGLSSMQLNRPERGFSFQAEGPLDMRMDPRRSLTAEQVVNQMDERELADLIFQFGDERRSRRISRAIVRARPLHSTTQLAGVVAAAARSIESASGRGNLHPATRTFQALRMYVNSELASINAWLEQLPTVVTPGGRAVAISFHSHEDRPVKQSFRAGAQAGIYRLLTPHVVRPSEEEQRRNPRSRSARLRAVERITAAATGPRSWRKPRAREHRPPGEE